MVYALTIVLLSYLIFRFDLTSLRLSKRADTWYRILFFWFVAVSGFAYNVGSDIPIYMYEYDSALWSNIHGFSDIIDFKERRQPGWVLLELICHSISSNFVILKLVVSLFCNWAVFRFIKRHSDYKFTSLLFYSLILYLHINFNSIRQGIAVGFFLIGLDYLFDGKMWKYLLMIACGWLFHNTIIICLLIPLFGRLKFSKTSLSIVSIIIVFSIFVLSRMNLQSFFYQALSNSDFLTSEDAQNMVEGYFGSATSRGASFIGLLVIAIRVAIIAIVTYVIYGVVNENERKYIIICMVLYLVLTVLNRLVPVVFSRLLQFFDVIYVCVLPKAINEIGKLSKSKIIVPILIVFFCINPIIVLRSTNRATGMPLMIQYAPYYSVFNPQIDPIRQSYFGSHP